MTTEDKAKRYDEAISQLKGLLDGIHEEKCDIIEEDIVRIFPELKEGDDERIRKWLIGYFNQYIIDDMPQVFSNGLNVKDVIAWLEKQEQKPAWGEEDENIISSVEAWLDTLCDYLKDSSSAYIPDVRVIIRKLKSLKDRYIWKPSDEQIDALEEAMYQVGILTPLGSKINDLCEQLKKLKEE